MLQRGTVLLLFFGLVFFACPAWAQEVQWDTLEASMVVLEDDAPRPDSITNRIELPVRLRTRLRKTPKFAAGDSDKTITPQPVATNKMDMSWKEIREVQQEFHERRRQNLEGGVTRDGSGLK